MLFHYNAVTLEYCLFESFSFELRLIGYFRNDFQSSLVKIITKTFRQLFEQEKALIPEMNLNGVTGFFWHTFSIENFTKCFYKPEQF